MATKPTSTPDSVTISQQALNLLHQILSATGWAKSVEDIYRGGQLLTEVLPALDPITDWVKSANEVQAMKPAARAAYQAKDHAWVNKPVTLTLTPKQAATIKVAFDHVASTGALGPSPFLTELIKAFQLCKDE